MLAAFLVSFGVIFVAELGDKSQLMALAFATRYKTMPVMIGITVSTALVHAVSVFVGAVVGAALPTRAITIVAAVAFIALAFGRCAATNSPRTTKSAPLGRRATRSSPSDSYSSWLSWATRRCLPPSLWQRVTA